MMITLYSFGPAFGLADPSPFVLKTATLLRMAELAYTNKAKGLKNAPKGKLPYIEDEGVIVADSTFIHWHIEKKYAINFDKNLSLSDQGVAWSVEKMLEDNLYWAILDSRWLDDDNFNRGPAIFFQNIPWFMRKLIIKMVRHDIAKRLKGQGTGRHNKQEIIEIASKDIQAVSAILGDNPYLMGTQPCGADATCYAFMAGILSKQFDTPLRYKAEQYGNLVAYVARMQKQFFPDFSMKEQKPSHA